MEKKEDISVLKKEYRKKGKQVRAALSAEERAKKSKIGRASCRERV